MIFQLVHEPPRDVAVDRGRARAAEGRRIGERLGRDDPLAEIVGEGRAVDRAERRLDEADRRPAAGAERVRCPPPRSPQPGQVGGSTQIDREPRQAAQPAARSGRLSASIPAMLSRPSRRVIPLPPNDFPERHSLGRRNHRQDAASPPPDPRAPARRPARGVPARARRRRPRRAAGRGRAPLPAGRRAWRTDRGAR